MLERSIETAFQEIADKEQPHSRISIQRALQDGRARLRVRRVLRAVGTPVLAAAAVLAIALPVSMSAGSDNATHERAVVVPTSPATSRRFSPLALYASFGWLPAKEPGIIFGQMQATSEELIDHGWDLRTYAVGRCERRGDHMECGWGKDEGDHTCLGNAYIQSRAPAIDGRPAFWAYDTGTKNWARQRCLTWEYRPGGWAYLTNSPEEINGSKRLIVRIASAVRFAARQPSFKFAAQLRNMPGRWQVGFQTNFYLTHGALLAGPYIITDGKTTLGINVGFGSPEHNKCLGTKSACRVINGYYVTRVKYGPVTKGGPQEFELWAADADNALVTIGPETYKHLGLMYTVFSHMKMLGTNPADWTTEPIS
jgi:hypothetical protein